MLLDAQNKAAELFAEIERSGSRHWHWHKRIVRDGTEHLAAVPEESAG
jgi:hypothetical protein